MFAVFACLLFVAFSSSYLYMLFVLILKSHFLSLSGCNRNSSALFALQMFQYFRALILTMFTIFFSIDLEQIISIYFVLFVFLHGNFHSKPVHNFICIRLILIAVFCFALSLALSFVLSFSLFVSHIHCFGHCL